MSIAQKLKLDYGQNMFQYNTQLHKQSVSAVVEGAYKIFTFADGSEIQLYWGI
ncbi:hypothetical protein VPHD479_0244 [Vibrio phage D479]